MEKYIEIFNKLWEHSENEVVEFKKAETNFDIDELANTSPLLAMKQTYVTMSLLGLYLAFGTKNIRLSVQHSRMVKLHSTV